MGPRQLARRARPRMTIALVRNVNSGTIGLWQSASPAAQANLRSELLEGDLHRAQRPEIGDGFVAGMHGVDAGAGAGRDHFAGAQAATDARLLIGEPDEHIHGVAEGAGAGALAQPFAIDAHRNGMAGEIEAAPILYPAAENAGDVDAAVSRGEQPALAGETARKACADDLDGAGHRRDGRSHFTARVGRGTGGQIARQLERELAFDGGHVRERDRNRRRALEHIGFQQFRRTRFGGAEQALRL